MSESDTPDMNGSGLLSRQLSWSGAGAWLFVLMTIALILNDQVVAYLHGLWGDLYEGEYSHGYLVLGISVFLIWRERQQLRVMQPGPSSLALMGVVVSGLLMLVATVVSIQTIQALSLLLLLMSIIWLVLGNRLAVRLAFPVLYMVFALPVWFPLSPLLQEITADAVFWLTRLAHIPAFREYNVIMLPAGSLAIEDACSGLRYLMAALTLGVLYARLNYTHPVAQVAVVLAAVLAAVAGNIIRVFVVVYLAYKTEMQHPWVTDHLNLGWYIFAAVMLFLLIIDAVLYRKDSSQATQQPGSLSDQVVTAQENAGVSLVRLTMLSTLAILSAAAGPLMQRWIADQPAIDAHDVLVELPEGNAVWSGPQRPAYNWKPVYHGAAETLQSYQRGGRSVQIYVGHYPVQQQGRELINVLNRISDRRQWTPLYAHPRVKSVRDRPVLEQLLENKNGGKLLVWFWYEVAGHPVASTLKAKLLQVLGLFNGKHGASIVAIASSWSDKSSAAPQILDEFSAFIESRMDIRLLQPAG